MARYTITVWHEDIYGRYSYRKVLLSPIFHCHKIKGGGYNNITNTNKVSPTQNTPALQANKKVTMITSTRILAPLRLKGLHFLLFRINKLNRDFFHWQFFSLVCPLRNLVTSLLSHQSLSSCKDCGNHE